jgi:hypothetical protein
MKPFIARMFASGAALALLMIMWAFPAAAVAAVSPANVPASSISGTTAHFSPPSLTATAKLPTGGQCSVTYASFEFINKEKVAETYTVTPKEGGSGSGSVPSGEGEYICIPKGFKGTVKVTLTKDKKVLTVRF